MSGNVTVTLEGGHLLLPDLLCHVLLRDRGICCSCLQEHSQDWKGKLICGQLMSTLIVMRQRLAPSPVVIISLKLLTGGQN